jgi:hypothetical protein
MVPADECKHISAEERACCYLVVVTDKNTLKEGLTLLQYGFLLISMRDEETWPHDSSLITVAEYRFAGTKLMLLRNVSECDVTLQDRYLFLFCFCSSASHTSVTCLLMLG